MPVIGRRMFVTAGHGSTARATHTAREHAAARERPVHEETVLDDGAAELGRFSLPPNVRLERDVAYGNDPKQRFDVYIPARASHAPVIFLVHGGGWRIGDKASRAVVENKVTRWTRAGFIVISTNYRLLPGTDPIAQAGDVARAIASPSGGCRSGAAIPIASCSSDTRRARTSPRSWRRTRRSSRIRRRARSSGHHPRQRGARRRGDDDVAAPSALRRGVRQPAKVLADGVAVSPARCGRSAHPARVLDAPQRLVQGQRAAS